VGRRFANDNRQWPVWFVTLSPHGYAQPVAPDTLGELRHVPLAAEEFPFAIFGFEQETLNSEAAAIAVFRLRRASICTGGEVSAKALVNCRTTVLKACPCWSAAGGTTGFRPWAG
jgi:hypothetical protein